MLVKNKNIFNFIELYFRCEYLIFQQLLLISKLGFFQHVYANRDFSEIKDAKTYKHYNDVGAMLEIRYRELESEVLRKKFFSCF